MAHPRADHQGPVILCVARAPPAASKVWRLGRIESRSGRFRRIAGPSQRRTPAAAGATRSFQPEVVLRRRQGSWPSAGWIGHAAGVGVPDPNRAVSAGRRTRPGTRARAATVRDRRGPAPNLGQTWLVPSSTVRRRRHAWPAARLMTNLAGTNRASASCRVRRGRAALPAPAPAPDRPGTPPRTRREPSR
jgi:hypothetical protein